ncbi:DUF1877 family protein [Promicromonospora vindobonensis]|uniref:DUF1877 family protein n=1 Tax=Promicromonospora vindobonensis TaxID=195748 RepID=A0ABW5VYX8_9MICO
MSHYFWRTAEAEVRNLLADPNAMIARTAELCQVAWDDDEREDPDVIDLDSWWRELQHVIMSSSLPMEALHGDTDVPDVTERAGGPIRWSSPKQVELYGFRMRQLDPDLEVWGTHQKMLLGRAPAAWERSEGEVVEMVGPVPPVARPRRRCSRPWPRHGHLDSVGP